MSVRAFRSRRWAAYILSLFVLGSAVWTPTSVYSQAFPGGGSQGAPSSPGVSWPISDEVFKVADDGDATKIVEFELSDETTANTVVLRVGGTAATPTFGIGTASNQWSVTGSTGGTNTRYSTANNSHCFDVVTTTSTCVTGTTGVSIRNTLQVGWASGDPGTTVMDTGSERLAAGVQAPTDGSTGAGWIQMQAADDMLAADFTSADATITATALNVTLAVRKYTFKMVLFFSNSTAADGIRVDFDGGAAAMTNFRVHCLVHDTALLLSQQATALATDIVATTTTGASQMECNGSAEPSGAGTFIVRAAEEADGGGTLTITRGSYIAFKDMP